MADPRRSWFRCARQTGGFTVPFAPSSSRRRTILPGVEDRNLLAVTGRDGVGYIGSFGAALQVASGGAMAVLLLAALIGLLMAPQARAADAGPTLPIETFLAERAPSASDALVSDMTAVYPVSTAGMARAPLRRGARLGSDYTQWLTQPIALVADDTASRAWLTQQGDALGALGVSVLVVRVQSLERMRALRAYRADLAMAPADVPELVDALRGVGAAIYPLVIMPDGRLLQDVRPLAPLAATPAGGAQ